MLYYHINIENAISLSLSVVCSNKSAKRQRYGYATSYIYIYHNNHHQMHRAISLCNAQFSRKKTIDYLTLHEELRECSGTVTAIASHHRIRHTSA